MPKLMEMNSTKKNNNNKKEGEETEANEICFDVWIEIFTYLIYLRCPIQMLYSNMC